MDTDAVKATQRAYTMIAADYAERQCRIASDWVERDVEHLVSTLGRGALVADVGCGPAQHTVLLRGAGLRAYGFDLSEAMLRSGGVDGVVRADMTALPVRSGALDGVWCSAALLHVPRELVPSALGEFRRVLRPGGELVLTIAEGDGERWEQVSYREDEQKRFFIYHSYGQITGALAAAGLEVRGSYRRRTHRDWLTLHVKQGTGVH